MYTYFDLGQFSVDDKRGIYCRIDFRYFYLCYYLVKISCTNEPLFNDKIELFEKKVTAHGGLPRTVPIYAYIML